MKATTALALALVPASMVLMSQGVQAQGQSGTTLTADKTAEGTWEARTTYDWTLEKSVSETQVQLDEGESHVLTYTLTADRGEPVVTEVSQVTGEICVTNGGAVTTENLTLVDQVEYKVGAGQFEPLVGATQTIEPEELAPGESGCYPYVIEFTPVEGAQYRNSVQVTITNHSGSLGEPKGPNPKADFSLPAEPTQVVVDETATLTDSMVCPEGYVCVPSQVGPWDLSDDMVIVYEVEVTNENATCSTSSELPNTAVLTEDDTLTEHTDSESVGLMSEVCDEGGGDEVCTRTIGYWKTHAGGRGNNEDVVTQYLSQWLGDVGGAATLEVDTATTAINVLNMNVYGKSSNGITKLYAQFLGVKLNAAAGADTTDIDAAMTAADAFLAEHDWEDWKNLPMVEKVMVMGWMTMFDAYNNGEVGPAHCE